MIREQRTHKSQLQGPFEIRSEQRDGKITVFQLKEGKSKTLACEYVLRKLLGLKRSKLSYHVHKLVPVNANVACSMSVIVLT